MHRALKIAPLAALVAVGAVGCSDFLSGGELTTDPNRPSDVSVQQLMVSTQTNLWAQLSSDPARLAGMWSRQLAGAQQQYLALYEYGVSEATTNGFNQSLYLGGGLVDIRALQDVARETGDSTTLGIGQVVEAALIGTGADLFGDLVYSQALQGGNPALDEQLDVYNQLQTLLDQAIVNLAATGPTNAGPGDADLVYGGDPELWTKLAYTLKARFFLHTGEVTPGAYASALAAAQNGLSDPSEDYHSVFSGGAGEQNFWYQFTQVQRSGYLTVDPFFVDLLTTRNDPRVADYFNEDGSDINEARLAPDYNQPLVTANENLLIWAEAAFRTNDEVTARAKLNEELALVGIAPVADALTGNALLAEILTEKYIAGYMTTEPWNDYKRTCWPNLPPVENPSGITEIPARLLYDTAERNTNTSIPEPSAQPARNDNDPDNPTPDPAPGEACLGQPQG